MCQDSSSCDLLNEIRYKTLCKLYNRYKLAIKIALENVNEKPIADAKMNELDSILQEIENYPISWSYYKLQEVQFTSDFESLVIFKDDKYLQLFKKKPNKTMVKSLLKKGEAKVKSLTDKNGNKFDAILKYEKNDKGYYSWLIKKIYC